MYRSTLSWRQHLLEMSGQLHAPAVLRPGEWSPVPMIEGWVGPRAGLGYMDKWKSPEATILTSSKSELDLITL
jgi:hypothetical protein